MAILTLQGLWLHNARDLNDHVEVVEFGAFVDELDIPGEVRRRAGGRLVAVRQRGQGRQFAVMLPMVSRDVQRWVRTHAGLEVLIRAPQRQKLYGVYFTPSISAQPGDGEANVSFTLEETTFFEGA